MKPGLGFWGALLAFGIYLPTFLILGGGRQYMDEP